ncbi:hypothetical protein DL765_001414 [Monosporascus sp. GIB2]|nr:hypothetical protein DL765_001414 [Monosporascus sp. GIB2]
MLSTRAALPKDAKHDFYSFTADEMDRSNGGSVLGSEFGSNALLFVSAGGDTTATALAALFFYLSHNPRCYGELADEIRSTFQAGDDIRSGPALASCRYLRASIDEALRLSPPIGGTLWREATRSDQEPNPFTVDGHVIPPGTQIGVNTYALHHNERYFPDPFAFKPDRWLESADAAKPEEQERLKLMREALNPFSTGVRGCPGKSLAYMEMSLAMAKTLFYFDFEVDRGEKGEKGKRRGKGSTPPPTVFACRDVFTSTHDGPYLTFRPRGNLVDELAASK